MSQQFKIVGVLHDTSSPAYPEKEITMFVPDSLTLDSLDDYFRKHAIDKLGYANGFVNMSKTIRLNSLSELTDEQLVVLACDQKLNKMPLHLTFKTGVRNSLISHLETEYNTLENHILNSAEESSQDLWRLDQIMDEIASISHAFKSQK